MGSICKNSCIHSSLPIPPLRAPFFTGRVAPSPPQFKVTWAARVATDGTNYCRPTVTLNAHSYPTRFKQNAVGSLQNTAPPVFIAGPRMNRAGIKTAYKALDSITGFDPLGTTASDVNCKRWSSNFVSVGVVGIVGRIMA